MDYKPQKQDGTPSKPWTISCDGTTCVDATQGWAVTCYRTKRDAQAAIDAHELASTRRPGGANLEAETPADPADYVVCPVCAAEPFTSHRKWCNSNGGWMKKSAVAASLLKEAAALTGEPADSLRCESCGDWVHASRILWHRVRQADGETLEVPLCGKCAGIDRTTTTQTNAASIEQRADAVKATAERILQTVGNYYGEGIPAHEVAAIEARVESIIGNAMQMAGEAALVRQADAYRQFTTPAVSEPSTAPARPMITVIIEDGLVQEVQSDAGAGGADLYVLDLDTDGAEDADAIPAPYVHDDQDNEWSAAYVTRWTDDLKEMPAGLRAALLALTR